MKYNSTNKNNSNAIIDDVEVTGDNLTSRAGLSLFVRYLRSIVLFPYLEEIFFKIRKNNKGQGITEIFKQLFCFLLEQVPTMHFLSSCL